MTARALMLMGTGSDVGKSLIAAGLCRLFADRGLRVRPFKPQNMSNNAAVTADGGEIGRAQALQARAARVPASVHMNPVLLKPESQTGTQVIVQGRRAETLSARTYFRNRSAYLPRILESFRLLAAEADLILIEGAGSPAEVNLRQGDLANMGFAAAADVPAVLIGDIHRGGVIASIAGTFSVIDPEDARRIKAFVINNFQGDPDLFSEGRAFAERMTGRPCLGVVPHFTQARRLPAEDALALDRLSPERWDGLRIAVPRLPRIANFDDLDPLRQEPGVTVALVQAGEVIADADLILLPGTKSTNSDLGYLRAQGWDIDILAHNRRGGAVIGLCGGYQMLGRMIHDPHGLEGPPGSVPGLGLLDVETVMEPEKTLAATDAVHTASGAAIHGYEIHLGRTEGPATALPFASIGGRGDGARSADGRINGTYLHGCFAADGFRRAFLAGLGATLDSGHSYEAEIERTLDGLADHLGRHLDIERLLGLAGPVRG